MGMPFKTGSDLGFGWEMVGLGRERGRATGRFVRIAIAGRVIFAIWQKIVVGGVRAGVC